MVSSISSDREVVSELTCLISKLAIKLLVTRTIKENGAGCTVLVFLPTYMLIEAVHKQLSEADSLPHNVPLYVLHSSVDIEDCMAALHGEDGAAARVVLASSVAESSITIKTLRPPTAAGSAHRERCNAVRRKRPVLLLSSRLLQRGTLPLRPRVLG